ncbi:MAG TPA: CoA-transferase [Acidimicrobiia bacterium]|jgi:acyl CoA:acetate/3-ketoacid CoA transferase alpha subunit/acyl CoA:acetate/3-ketoacid CoA transferase beta subunit|nr:CoA-transferase [Acidimicrobiia bacterium]
MSGRQTTLSDAVARHVQAGDTLHLVVGHHRWTAAAREVVRQWWERDPQFTLVMLSLSSLGALFFRGGLVRKVITGYSGDTFPNFTPNPWFANAYKRGEVEVEHWSFLAFSQRLEAAARGLPAIVTRSIAESSMEQNDGYARLDSPFGEVGLLAPLQPDVALLHAPVADRAGNVALQPPLLEGVWGALAAKRGAIVTVEKIVDDLRPWSHLVRIPAHRVLAVVETPMGAHPGGLYAGDLPVDGYGEDYDFWVSIRNATRSDDYDDWIRHWILEVDSQAEWLDRLGAERVAMLRSRAAADSWQQDEVAYPPDLETPPNNWERAAVLGARYLADRIIATDAHAVLAGAGVANLSAWLGVALAKARGSDVTLTAEIGLWGYDPVPADPFVLNHRNFPSATMLSDAPTVLGSLVGGYGTRTIGCLGGAQIDRAGNINSTLVPGGAFLVGSGGGNDVASVAEECIVVATLSPIRTPLECGYVTSPGRSVRALVTDLGLLEKSERGELVLTAVPEGPEPIAERVERARAECGWELEVAATVGELDAVTADEVNTLRRWDPRGWFLRAR